MASRIKKIQENRDNRDPCPIYRRAGSTLNPIVAKNKTPEKYKTEPRNALPIESPDYGQQQAQIGPGALKSPQTLGELRVRGAKGRVFENKVSPGGTVRQELPPLQRRTELPSVRPPPSRGRHLSVPRPASDAKALKNIQSFIKQNAKGQGQTNLGPLKRNSLAPQIS